MKCLIYALIVLCCSITSTTSAYSEDSRVGLLITKAQDANSFQTSVEQLRSIQNVSVSSRQEVVAELGKRMSDKSNLNALRTEVNLARELKLVELSSIIAKGLDEDTRGGGNGMTDFHQRASLDYDPAVKTLVAFGPKALPSLANELKNGNRIGRFRTVSALSFIKGPRVEALLREQLQVEPDPGLRSRISHELGIEQPVSR